MPKVKKSEVVRGERNTTTLAKTTKKKRALVAKKQLKAATKRVSARKGGTPAKRSARKAKSTSGRTTTKRGPLRPKRGTATKKSDGRARAATKRAPAVRAAPAVRFAVKALDPLRKCGPNTSVQLLYRVDESEGDRRTAHLVYFDRHGWYCEHGRACPAVGYARKYKGQIARAS